MKHFDHEEEFHSRDRKESRKIRKQAQKLDRSKYKKTDQKKEIAKERPEDAHLGRVLRVTGEGSWVEFENQEFLCSIKGFLKKEKTRAKNLVAVGDFVLFQKTSEKEGAILQIEPRKSLLSRRDISGKKEQLIAVNIDYAIISASVVEPTLKPALIDRYLIAAEKGNLKPIIVINKIDLLKHSPQEKKLYKEFLKAYEPLGYPIFSLSVEKKKGLKEFKEKILGKTCVFSGQSGVGKSSLLNALFKLKLKTGELTQKTAKGAHTTTRAELISLPGGGYCVDTPGIRSFGIWDLSIEEVKEHFQDIAQFGMHCKFPDCTHQNEPECKVQEAIEEEKIPRLRSESYFSLLEEALSKKEKTTWN